VIRVPLTTTIAAASSEGRFVSYSQAGDPPQRIRISSTYGGVAVINDIDFGRANTVGSSDAQTSLAPTTLIDNNEAGPAPRVSSVVNGASFTEAGACSPGAAAVLIGSGLVSADATPTLVAVNGEPVPVMVATPSRVTFECPELVAGTPLAITVTTADGVSNVAKIDMNELAPGIFKLDAAEGASGTIVLESTGELAINAPGATGKAKQGETISILTTGLGLPVGFDDGELSTTPIVTIGGLSAQVLSVTKVGTGVSQVTVRIPDAASIGDAVPVHLQMSTVDGRVVEGNIVTIGVERGAGEE
jgi:uncharacterized protein (TIGR03437 family)